jgi:hypothetical protein
MSYVDAVVTIEHKDGNTYIARCSKLNDRALATLTNAILATPETANTVRIEGQPCIQFTLTADLDQMELRELADEWASWLNV